MTIRSGRTPLLVALWLVLAGGFVIVRARGAGLGWDDAVMVLVPLVLTAPLAWLAARFHTPGSRPRQTASGAHPSEDVLLASHCITEPDTLDRLIVMEMARSRRYDRAFSFVLVGVEDWAAVRTERGSKGAAALLAALAASTRRVLRTVDSIGLHGDGLLAILLPETGLDGARVVVDKVAHTAHEQHGLHVRAGAAIFPHDGGTIDELLREAEAALDLARLAGVSVVERASLG
ncbi:MAG: diguanylate cyclase [Chloroflexi bacterium]|nr:diguanylate cyclase [Chloroflexota bacterium]